VASSASATPAESMTWATALGSTNADGTAGAMSASPPAIMPAAHHSRPGNHSSNPQANLRGTAPEPGLDTRSGQGGTRSGHHRARWAGRLPPNSTVAMVAVELYGRKQMGRGKGPRSRRPCGRTGFRPRAQPTARQGE